MNDITEAELLQAIINEFVLPEIEPNEITVMQLANKSDKTVRSAAYFLESKYQDGVMSRRKVRLPSGLPGWAYRAKVSPS
jgi:hypothetical protein